jgi:hypothetical protein
VGSGSGRGGQSTPSVQHECGGWPRPRASHAGRSGRLRPVRCRVTEARPVADHPFDPGRGLGAIKALCLGPVIAGGQPAEADDAHDCSSQQRVQTKVHGMSIPWCTCLGLPSRKLGTGGLSAVFGQVLLGGKAAQALPLDLAPGAVIVFGPLAAEVTHATRRCGGCAAERAGHPPAVRPALPSA